MGRVLDTLKQGDGSRGKAAKTSPTPALQDECVVEWTLDEGEVPFIEVGGTVPEASPDVLATGPLPTARSERARPAAPAVAEAEG